MSAYLDIPSELADARRSRRQRYQELVIGRPGWWALLRYELIVLLASWVPGAFGLWLRAVLYPRLLGACGRNVAFGVNVTLRHPHKIRIGDSVTIDDGCVLDAKGVANRGITIGNRVFIGRSTILTCKDGDLEIGDDVSIGFNCSIFSASEVRIGPSTLLAAYCFLVGGGHQYDRVDIPVIQQARPSKGIEVGPNVWLGTRVTVLDGTHVGEGAIVGASAVVTGDVPAFSIAAGIPARVIRARHEYADGRDRRNA